MQMLAAIGASLAVDKAAYMVGEFPTFRILGAKPGAQILWTTWRNGEALEYEQSHGEVVSANGTAELQHPTFKAEDAGYWEKQVIIKHDDGGRDLAQVFFTVNTVAPMPDGVEPSAPGPMGFFDQSINLFGVQLPTWLVVGGGLFLAYKFTKK